MNIKSVLLNIAHDLENERFDLINRGGCCWFAGVLATELEKRKVPFTFIMRESTERATVEEYINQSNNEDHGLSAWHVYIKVAGSCFDSDGFYNDDYIQDLSDYIIEFHWDATQIKNYYRNGDWNYSFVRNSPEGIKKEIRGIIKNNFKQYDTKDSTRH
jgi:hypothetical protein